MGDVLKVTVEDMKVYRTMFFKLQTIKSQIIHLPDGNLKTSEVLNNLDSVVPSQF